MTSVIAITPKEGSADDVKQLIVDSRADGIEGLEKYSIVLTREEQLLVINEWVSLDAFMDYVNGPHNMIELIEHLCDRYDEENVCKAYSGTVINEEFDKATEDLRVAVSNLGKVVGKVDVEEILSSIFNDFCIGK